MKTTFNSLLACFTVLAITAAVPALAKGKAKDASKATKAEEKTKEVKELVVVDEKKGTGTEATSGKTVVVHYTGWLTDGKKFDSSLDRKEPFSFLLGAGQVIPGWDQGVTGMKVGGKRKLTIPPQLGYGAQGAGSAIPPNSTLVFEVELIDVKG